ncbi:MAG: ABC transporter permease [Labilithrix sp.]|nr:ABC transporter permease [Labilithrix sp.]MCW5816390.1 ABC transporter permease [Labilithrix sp.]
MAAGEEGGGARSGRGDAAMMGTLDLLRSLGGAFAHRVRAFLTLLGIMIGTGSIVLLASLIVGGKTLLIEQNQRVSDSDVIAVDQKDAPQAQREKTTRPLTRSDGDVLAESEALGGPLVASEFSASWELARYAGKEKRVAVVSASAATLELYRLTIEKGRPLDDEDKRSGAHVAVVGHRVYEELLGSHALDDSLRLAVGGKLFNVVGVLAHKPTMGSKEGTWAWDNKVLLPETTFDAIYSPEHKVGRVYVRGPSSPEARLGARATVQSTLLRRHFGVMNFALRQDQSGGNEELILTVIQVLLLGTGVLALLASGINIMNVMLVSVSERRREIGLRRAIGATPGSIMVQFLLEAAALSLSGGVLGVLGGVGVAWLVAVVARSSLGRWEFTLPAWSIALGLALAVVTGVVFGLAPAWRAAKVSPIDALRGE